MRYVVRTYSVVPRIGAFEIDRPDVETWCEDPAEAAELFMELIQRDGTVQQRTGHRLLTCILRGDRSFAVLSHHSYYTVEALP